MPTVQEAPTVAFAHCRDARCPGYAQEEVDAVREETSWTYGERGGDGVFTHMVEDSSITFRFADDSSVPCPVCASAREVTGSHRPQYQPLSGHDPMGLLSVPRFDPAAADVPSHVRGETDEEMEARLRQEIREERMRERLRAETVD
jgi:hypothetical protein